MNKIAISKINAIVYDAANEVYKHLGPGLDSNVYKACLTKELELKGVSCKKNVLFPLYYKQYELDTDLAVDLLVEDELIIKVLTIEKISFTHEAHLGSILNLTKRKAGVLINFNVPKLIDGFKKVFRS